MNRRVAPERVREIARRRTTSLGRSYSAPELVKLSDDLSYDRGLFEGVHGQLKEIGKGTRRGGVLKNIGWAATVGSLAFGFADILLTGGVGTLALLSLGSGAGGAGIALLGEGREARSLETLDRRLEELRTELRYLTTAHARVNGALTLE